MRFEPVILTKSSLPARIMRLVTWTGVCDEAGERQYRAIKETHLIVTPGHAGGVKHQYVFFVDIDCIDQADHTT